MLKDLIQNVSDLSFPVVHIIIGLVAGVIINWVVAISLTITVKKAKSNDLLIFRKWCKTAFNTLVPVASIFIVLNYAEDTDTSRILIKTFLILLIIASVHFLIRVLYAMEDIFLDRYDIDKEDNRKERKILTQINFLKKVFIVVIE